MVDPLDIRVESEIEREIEAEMAIEEGQGQASSASLGLPLFKVRRDDSFRVRLRVLRGYEGSDTRADGLWFCDRGWTSRFLRRRKKTTRRRRRTTTK